MQHTIDVPQEDLIAKHNAAIEALRAKYARFDDFTELLRAHPETPTLEDFRKCCKVIGFEGYQVTAWYNHIWPL